MRKQHYCASNKIKPKNLFILILLTFAPQWAAAKTSDLDAFIADAEWVEANTNTGIKRYFGDKPNQPHSPVIIGDTAYWLAGNGYNNGSGVKNDVVSKNLVTGDIEVEASIGNVYPQNYLKDNAVIEYRGRIFSFGGAANFINHTFNTLVEYDPQSGEWWQLSASPLARKGAMAEQYNGKIYTFGGWGFDTFNRAKLGLDSDGFFFSNIDELPKWRTEIQVYDIEHGEWSTLGDIPTELPVRASTIIQDNIYLSAEQDWITPSNVIDIYNVTQESWSTLNIPESLVSKKLVSVGHLLFIYGTPEYVLSTNSYWQSYVYDTQANEWLEGIPLPTQDEIIPVFGLVSEDNALYYIEYSSEYNDDTDKRVFKLTLDVATTPDESYIPREEPNISELVLENDDTLFINEEGTVVNLVLDDLNDYDLIWKGDGSFSQKEALRRVSRALYSKLSDSYQFIFLVFNEDEPAPAPAPYGYHTPIKNDITGLGQGIFDFTEDYGSANNLESIIVLSTSEDIIYGPSLHELGHRWGNYLTGSLDSLRHLGWFNSFNPQHLSFHWGFLSSAGQLGGWYDEDLNFEGAGEGVYMLNDGQEGTAGYNGIGPGNNYIGYSNLELYLMGILPPSAVGTLREPIEPPVETEVYPLFEISAFHDISMDTVLAENGVRTPDSSNSPRSFNSLFVVVSKESLTPSKWHNYHLQVQNFTKEGHDDYLRLSNFWEATDGNGTLIVPNAHEQLVENEDEDATTYTRGDYDGDGLADLAVRRSSTFMQYIVYSDDANIGRVEFGKSEGDIPLIGDFDGDGIGDVSVRRPSNSMWYIKNSSDGDIQRIHFGKQAGDIPVPADYDGDGITDVAVRRPSSQMWYIKNSSDGMIQRIHFGMQEGDIPVPADYDGDGIADVAVRRPSNQMWYIKNSSDGIIQRIHFGKQEDDIPVPADYDGDGKTDVAVRRPSTQMWYIKNSSDGGIQRIHFGKQEEDIPIPADYDGDGKADVAVRRPSTYMQYIRRTSDNEIQRREFGKHVNDVPLLAPIKLKMSMISH